MSDHKRCGLKVFAYGGTWLLAPHMRAARKQVRQVHEQHPRASGK